MTEIRIDNFFNTLHKLLVDDNNYCVKIFKGTSCSMYAYENNKSQYICKKTWDVAGSNSDVEAIYESMVKATSNMKSFKLCRLEKKESGFRFRFDEHEKLTHDGKDSTLKLIRRRVKEDLLYSKGVFVPKDEQIKWTPVSTNKKVVEKTNKEKKMNDFSLTNLKNAIINKVTTLDKKTITIIGILILLLLIATRYQDIKDILIGIKDKIKRSKNFKAMMSDGEKAIDSLKKIVGVKSTGDNVNE